MADARDAAKKKKAAEKKGAKPASIVKPAPPATKPAAKTGKK